MTAKIYDRRRGVAVNGIMSAVVPNGGGTCDGMASSPSAVSAGEDYEPWMFPVMEDLAVWINNTLGEAVVSPDSFLSDLENGAVVCKLARAISNQATKAVPEFTCRLWTNASRTSFFARDNVANFLRWCRSLGVSDIMIFESEDLVLQGNPRAVVLGLLEVSRKASHLGVQPPSIIQLEHEIDDLSISSSRPESPQTSWSRASSLTNLDRKVLEVARGGAVHIHRLSEGRYKIAGKVVFVRLLNDRHVMVRVGGGWDTLEHYVERHQPGQEAREVVGEVLMQGRSTDDHSRPNSSMAAFHPADRYGEWDNGTSRRTSTGGTPRTVPTSPQRRASLGCEPRLPLSVVNTARAANNAARRSFSHDGNVPITTYSQIPRHRSPSGVDSTSQIHQLNGISNGKRYTRSVSAKITNGHLSNGDTEPSRPRSCLPGIRTPKTNGTFVDGKLPQRRSSEQIPAPRISSTSKSPLQVNTRVTTVTRRLSATEQR